MQFALRKRFLLRFCAVPLVKRGLVSFLAARRLKSPIFLGDCKLYDS